MGEKEPRIMTAEEVWQGLEDAATPIDFKTLIAEGVLEKDGAWYKILNNDALPRHVSMKIKTIQSHPKKGMRVQFRAASKRAATLLKKRPRA